jgi:hypothetical protein
MTDGEIGINPTVPVFIVVSMRRDNRHPADRTAL